MATAKQKRIPFQVKQDARGQLVIAETFKQVPFHIERIFYIYGVPADLVRGAHAHRECHQFIISMNGSVEIECDDGRSKETFILSTPVEGLWVPPMIWTSLKKFSPGAIALVLASAHYDESDYIRNYDAFLSTLRRPA
jgi:dTDP-4-dehydrorhamnose 3,5-epimerase-like enzyme